MINTGNTVQKHLIPALMPRIFLWYFHLHLVSCCRQKPGSYLDEPWVLQVVSCFSEQQWYHSVRWFLLSTLTANENPEKQPYICLISKHKFEKIAALMAFCHWVYPCDQSRHQIACSPYYKEILKTCTQIISSCVCIYELHRKLDFEVRLTELL